MTTSRTLAAERVPVPFVVGVGRSGTTLLRLMLDSHPDLAIPSETGFLAPLLAARQAANEASARWIEVRFEDLVGRPEATLRALAAPLALAFDPAMLAHAERASERLAEIGDVHLPDGRTIGRDQRLAQHPRLSSPADPKRAGRWRTEMNAAERAAFEEIAGDLLEELGYPFS